MRRSSGESPPETLIAASMAGKPSGAAPGVLIAQTSSSTKSPVNSWTRQGMLVCAAFASLIVGYPLPVYTPPYIQGG